MAMVGIFTPWKLSNSPIYVSDSHIYNCDTQSYFWKPDQIFQWLAGCLLTDIVDMIPWTPTPGQITWSSLPLTLLLFLFVVVVVSALIPNVHLPTAKRAAFLPVLQPRNNRIIFLFPLHLNLPKSSPQVLLSASLTCFLWPLL